MVMDSYRHHDRDGRPDWHEVLRGVRAVVVLLLTALDALVTAVLGIRPLAPVIARLGHALVDEYRAGANDWIDVEVIDIEDDDAEGVEP
jgi:hypothetical protein